MSRHAEITRATKETRIRVSLDLDGSGRAEVKCTMAHTARRPISISKGLSSFIVRFAVKVHVGRPRGIRRRGGAAHPFIRARTALSRRFR